MATEIITKEDLDAFERRLISKIEALIGNREEERPKWLKSYQVKNMLRISPNTLHKLRMDGTLPSTKIGGILYYSYADIIRIMNGQVDKPKNRLR